MQNKYHLNSKNHETLGNVYSSVILYVEVVFNVIPMSKDGFLLFMGSGQNTTFLAIL